MEKSIPKPYRRKHYFIEKKFQANFILKFCSLVALGGLLTIGIFYLLAMQSTAVSLLNSRVAARTTADSIMPVLIQTLLIVTVVVGLATIAVTLFFSHKIAGPLFRVKKVMQELAGGDFSSDFHIRELDQLQELANTFNSTIKETRERIQAIKDGLNSLRDGLNKISDDEIAENKRVLLSELKKVSEVLVMVSRYFKTVC